MNPPDLPPPASTPAESRACERHLDVFVFDSEGDGLPIQQAVVAVNRGGRRQIYHTDHGGRAATLAMDGDTIDASAFGHSECRSVDSGCGSMRFDLPVGVHVEIVSDQGHGCAPSDHVKQGRTAWIRIQSNLPRKHSQAEPHIAISRVSQGRIVEGPRYTRTKNCIIAEFVYDSQRASGRVEFEAFVTDESEESPRQTASPENSSQ